MVKKNHKLVDMDLLYGFQPKSMSSVAFYKDSTKPLQGENIAFLPLDEIEWERTGRKENGRDICTVTMPQWLAEAEELV